MKFSLRFICFVRVDFFFLPCNALSLCPFVGCHCRENVLFGHRFDEYFYGRVLDACELYADIAMLSNGDQTDVGEKVSESKLLSGRVW